VDLQSVPENINHRQAVAGFIYDGVLRGKSGWEKTKVLVAFDNAIFGKA
jgi:hypothetical protein